MNALFLLFLALTTSTIVLHSGDRIKVDGTVRQEKGVVTFRSHGSLYSLPASEIARIETTAITAEEKPVAKLRVSDEERKRLIAELEKNHSGTPPPSSKVLTEPRPLPPAPDPGEETAWRNRAREHEENIRRAKEELELLEQRVQGLKAEINTLLVLGFSPKDFTYQSTQLARATEQIPYAELEVTRAQRAYEQFKEEARRQGILPGWLR